MIDQKKGKAKHWNLGRLSSRENPLVLFTLSAQAAAGAFALPFIGAQLGIAEFVAFSQSAIYAPLGILAFFLVAFGLFMSTMHLGKPLRFYRGFNNLRHSPVCREGLGVAIFMAMMSAHIAFSLPANSVFQGLFTNLTGMEIGSLISAETASKLANIFAYIAIPASMVGLYYMNRCYRIKARPFWNHWQVGSNFGGSALSLGALVAGAVMIATVVVVVATHDLAKGVLVGVLLSGLFFAHKVGRLLYVGTATTHEGRAREYTVVGQVFFASADRFVASFDYKEVVDRVHIDVKHLALRGAPGGLRRLRCGAGGSGLLPGQKRHRGGIGACRPRPPGPL